jgi:hypothetical protein
MSTSQCPAFGGKADIAFHHCVIKQRESSKARHLVAQAIIDCAHKGIREPDEKRRCAYEDPDRLNRRET